MSDDQPASLPPAGWYPDPDGAPGTRRWWDGASWGQRAAAPPDRAEPDDPPRSLVRLQWLAIVGIAILTAVEVANVFTFLTYLDVGDRILAGDVPPLSEIVDVEDRVERTGVVAVVSYLALAPVMFIPWFHGAYRNVSRLGGRRRYGAGWAIGGWFIPIFNPIRPKQVANDIYRASVAQSSDPDTGDPPVSLLVHCWWAAFVVGLILARVSYVVVRNANDAPVTAATARELIGDEQSGIEIAIAASGLTILAGILCILVVRKITVLQAERARGLDRSATLPAAGPDSSAG